MVRRTTGRELKVFVSLCCLVFWPLQASADVLLVAYSADHQVAFFDPATYELLATLPTGQGPHEIATSADGRLAAVAISGAGPGGEPGHAVTIVDLEKRTVKATIDLGSYTGSHDVRISRDNSIVWVACALAKAVLEVEASTGKILHAWKLERDGGWFVAVTPDEKKIFVPHLEGKAVSIIRRADGTVRTLPMPTGQAGLDISPDGREVWVGGAEDNTITVIDAAEERVVANFPSGGQGFTRLRFTSDGEQVVVVQGEDFSVFDAASRRRIGGLKLPRPGKVVTVSPEGRYAFLSHPSANQVSVIDLRTLELVTSFPTGKAPDGVAWVGSK